MSLRGSHDNGVVHDEVESILYLTPTIGTLSVKLLLEKSLQKRFQESFTLKVLRSTNYTLALFARTI